MNSAASRRFWKLFNSLPNPVQELAIKNFKLWKRDPGHPSLQFRRLQDRGTLYSARIGDHYRALGHLESGTLTWVWIGTHAEYDQLIRRP